MGGVRESWTAVCYILIAEFADHLPHDEDQMPLNGNPHPMPGNQQFGDNNNFANPPFPKIGWNHQEDLQQHFDQNNANNFSNSKITMQVVFNNKMI